VTRCVRSLQDKQQQCASERAVVVTGRVSPNDRTRCTRRSIEVQRAPRAIGHVRSLQDRTRHRVSFMSCHQAAQVKLTGRSGPGDPQTHWSCAFPLRLGELTGRAGPPWTTSGPTSGHCFSVRNIPDLRLHFSVSGAVENRRFTSPKSVESRLPSSAGGREEPKPSLPLKLHRLHKCANTTKCTPPYACVLAF
jgi:hypothetical protein